MRLACMLLIQCKIAHKRRYHRDELVLPPDSRHACTPQTCKGKQKQNLFSFSLYCLCKCSHSYQTSCQDDLQILSFHPLTTCYQWQALQEVHTSALKPRLSLLWTKYTSHYITWHIYVHMQVWRYPWICIYIYWYTISVNVEIIIIWILILNKWNLKSMDWN